jgi:hypothetical protein
VSQVWPDAQSLSVWQPVTEDATHWPLLTSQTWLFEQSLESLQPDVLPELHWLLVGSHVRPVAHWLESVELPPNWPLLHVPLWQLSALGHSVSSVHEPPSFDTHALLSGSQICPEAQSESVVHWFCAGTLVAHAMVVQCDAPSPSLSQQLWPPVQSLSVLQSGSALVGGFVAHAVAEQCGVPVSFGSQQFGVEPVHWSSVVHTGPMFEAFETQHWMSVGPGQKLGTDVESDCALHADVLMHCPERPLAVHELPPPPPSVPPSPSPPPSAPPSPSPLPLLATLPRRMSW